MKQLLFILLLLGAWPAYASVTAGDFDYAADVGSFSSVSTTGVNHNAGNAILVACANTGSSQTVTSVTNAAGDTFTTHASATRLTSATYQITFYWTLSSIGDADDEVTCTWSGAVTNPSVAVLEVIHTGSFSFDVAKMSSGESAGTSYPVGSFDTDDSGIVFYASRVGAACPDEPAGHTDLSMCGDSYIIYGSAQTGINPTGSSATSQDWVAGALSMTENTGDSPYVMSGCTQSALENVLEDAAADPGPIVEVVLASCSGGSSVHITSQISFTAHPSNTYLLIRGQGSSSTVLIDDVTGTAAPIVFTASINGIVEINDLQLIGGNINGHDKNQGIIQFGTSETTLLKIHDNIFDAQYDMMSGHGGGIFRLHGCARGVIYNNAFIYSYSGITQDSDGCGGSNGDATWAQDTGFGTSDFLFVEDNTFTACAGAGDDGYNGAKLVVRYNSLGDNCNLQTHPTGGSLRARGMRAFEYYGNTFDNWTYIQGNCFWISNGTGMIWGNSIAFDRCQHFITFHEMRRNSGAASSYGQGIPEHGNSSTGGWGYCNPFATGTADTSGTTVTKDAGDSWDTSWNQGGISGIIMIFLKSLNSDVAYFVDSITSTTVLDTTASIGTNMDKTFWIGSHADGNTDIYGYPCLDQVGRGKGDLLSGAFGSMLNEDNSCNISAACFYPDQQLEPVIVFGNTWSGTPSNPSNAARAGAEITQIANNRDYRIDVDPDASNMSSPLGLDGGAGIEVGPIGSRPATCTAGVFWWADDEGGDWAVGIGDANDGKMYWCKTEDTWVASYGAYNESPNGGTAGVPFSYPHYLRNVNPTGTSIASSPGGLNRARIRVR